MSSHSVQAFQHFESLTMEGCIFQFFSLLSKFHAIDVEQFPNCAVGVWKTDYCVFIIASSKPRPLPRPLQDNQMTQLTSEIFVGANCNVEFRQEGGERRFLAAFADIQDIAYETELMSRGRITMDVKTGGMVSGGAGLVYDSAVYSLLPLSAVSGDSYRYLSSSHPPGHSN